MKPAASGPVRIAPRVAIVSDAIFPYNKGGKEVRYHEIGRRLVASGVRVDVYSMHWWDDDAKSIEIDGVWFHALCKNHALYSGSRRSIRQALWFSLACLRLLGRRFDVIEADHMPYLPLFALRVVATLKRRQLVVTWHEVWGHRYWVEYLGFAGRIAAMLELFAMRLPNLIVADVQETADRLHACGVAPSRVVVVPIGVDAAAISAVPRGDRHFDVVCVGRLLEHKRVNVLIAALADQRARGNVLTCAVVGEGPECDALAWQVRELGIEDQVSFFGRVELHADVWALMKSSTVLALPSVREGFGIVVLEAIAAGASVVTSDHEDNQARSLVDDGITGVVCASEPIAFGESLARLVREPLAIMDVRDDVLKSFDWAAIIASLQDIYAKKSRVAA